MEMSKDQRDKTHQTHQTHESVGVQGLCVMGAVVSRTTLQVSGRSNVKTLKVSRRSRCQDARPRCSSISQGRLHKRLSCMWYPLHACALLHVVPLACMCSLACGTPSMCYRKTCNNLYPKIHGANQAKLTAYAMTAHAMTAHAMTGHAAYRMTAHEPADEPADAAADASQVQQLQCTTSRAERQAVDKEG